MSELTYDAIRKAGVRARERAMQRAGSSRINDAAWYPEVMLLGDKGYSMAQIAQALRLSERRIRQIKAGGVATGDAMIKLIPEPVAPERMTPEIKAMLEFTPDAFQAFYEAFSGKKLIALHKSWVRDFIENRNLLINVPPRHGKSHIFSVWVPLWLFARNRNEQILLVSAGKDLATTLSYEISYHLEYNQDLISAFGRFAPDRKGDSPWRPSRGELLLVGRTRETKSGQLSLQVRGSGQHVLGMEATVAICDDPTDAEVSRSEVERDKRWRWIREQVLTRIEPSEPGGASGRAVVVGQRVHIRDLYGEIAKQRVLRGPKKGKPTWHTVVYPAVRRWPDDDPLNPEPIVLWPEKWDYENLMETYERIGHEAFECMYQQNPLPEDAQFVHPTWWARVRDLDRVRGQAARRDEDEDADTATFVRVFSIDPSPTEWNALVVADVLSSRDSFGAVVLEFKTWKGGSRELQLEVERVLAQYRPEYFILESSTMTKWFEGEPYFQGLRSRITVIPHQTGKNKGDPELGVRSLASDIEQGRISTPYGDADSRAMTEQFEFQAERYGWGYEFDLLMALWFIKWNYRRLVPRSRQRTFATGTPGAWGYFARERARKTTSEDERMKKWRKQHVGVR